jgi:CRISPR/Cas system-associated exonuclease Cas4 (RecB family)
MLLLLVTKQIPNNIGKHMQLSKTDFIHYLNCDKSLWLSKHEEEKYPQGEFSTFLQKLVREGYEVEHYVQEFFKTFDCASVDHQREFKTDQGLYARADAFVVTNDGEHHLFEVKSSTKVKKDKHHDPIKDACFQLITAEQSGQAIDRVFIVHLNGGYVRQGDIVPEELLHFEDVTDKVREVYDETAAEIAQALSFLAQTEMDHSGCSCLYKSQANHCDSFDYFNPDIPRPSIYNLPRLSDKKRRELLDGGMISLQDVPVDFPLSDTQAGVLLSAHAGGPQIDVAGIKEELGEYIFPLYFFDYETFASAVPLVDRCSPHKAFPVQYSLHILEEDGTLTHKEFLQRDAELPIKLIEQMEKDIGDAGSIVSWHASFEKTQNKEMAKWYPAKEEFLLNINDRMVDSEDFFKAMYVDACFGGSTSIKKVLPVICPQIGYDELDVQDGATAMEAWQKMINASPDEAEVIASSLLEYCYMDTFAMVDIYKFLRAL